MVVPLHLPAALDVAAAVERARSLAAAVERALSLAASPAGAVAAIIIIIIRRESKTKHNVDNLLVSCNVYVRRSASSSSADSDGGREDHY